MIGRSHVRVVAALVGGLPVSAWGQTLSAWVVESSPSLDRADVAGRRSEPGLDPDPHRVGPLLVRPAFTFLGGYQDNVFNEPDARGDALAIASARLDIGLDHPVHDIALVASGKLRRFAQSSTENSAEGQVQSRNRLALSETLGLEVTLDAAHRIEPRSSAGSALEAREPASFDRYHGQIGLDAELGRFHLAAGASVQQVGYDDLSLRSGERLDQSFRDTRSLGGSVRLAYDLSGFLSAFTQVSASRRTSLHAPAGRERDSRDINLSAGLKGELTPLVSVAISAGYQTRSYDNPLYRDFRGLGFSAEMEWYPTPLLTGQFTFTRRFRNSGNPDVPAILEDSFAVNLFYDPTRRLRLSLGGVLRRDRYLDVTTRVHRRELGFRAQYTLNRHVRLGAQVYWMDQSAPPNQLVNSFSSPGAAIGITFTP